MRGLYFSIRDRVRVRVRVGGRYLTLIVAWKVVHSR